MKWMKKFIKWFSLVLGIFGLIVPWAYVLFSKEYEYRHFAWGAFILLSAMAFVTLWGFTWLIYLIYAVVKAVKAAIGKQLQQDPKPRLLNVQQSIVIWVVASLLTVISIWHGLASAWDSDYSKFYWPKDGIWWMAIFPVLLIGAAAFMHFMRRKE